MNCELRDGHLKEVTFHGSQFILIHRPFNAVLPTRLIDKKENRSCFSNKLTNGFNFEGVNKMK
jgi:hypothetical protein